MTTLRILHLSDTHLMDGGALHQGTVDTVAAYRHTLAAFENAGPLDLVVVSGDASDDGSPASYRTLRSLTGDFASRHGAVAVYAMGNHDQRSGFRAVLGTGHPGSDVARSVAEPSATSEAPIVGVSEVAGYRIITLDSSVPHRTHGHVDATQLAWLQSELATNHGHGSVIVIHHPPVEPVTPLHQGIELINAAELASALAGTDTVAILSGHYHHHLSDVLASGSGSIPVVVTSGIVNSNDVLASPGHERAVAGSGGTLVTISALSNAEPARHGTVARVRTLPFRFHLPKDVSPDVVFDLDGATVADIAEKIAATPAERAGMERTPPTYSTAASPAPR
ncbi:hypothetical protein MB46_10560 [Arthrobacter alpinus]|uniref:metallophosphoesterase n=1 Tax=Arthrobacter alpinus TaxID=656366 RepID=UPI000678B391|nr:metallophosphoesterase [Arthrobacter alpinus]ALV45859.1 hypothetical protein MB46_10560 [Arthrobacter alpinus]